MVESIVFGRQWEGFAQHYYYSLADTFRTKMVITQHHPVCIAHEIIQTMFAVLLKVHGRMHNKLVKKNCDRDLPHTDEQLNKTKKLWTKRSTHTLSENHVIIFDAEIDVNKTDDRCWQMMKIFSQSK